MIEIDGSLHSGSGTLLRYGASLATLTAEPLHMSRIRAKRPKPGLRAQHVAAVSACATVSGGRLDNATVGSQEIIYYPGDTLEGGSFHFDIGTAGSATMAAFTLIPPALFSSGPSRLTITGGLFQDFAPSFHHEEELETYYNPNDPEFKKKYGPRGVIHSWSDGKGGQKIEDTGPLTRARMPTADLEFYDDANKFIEAAVREKKPFFVWFNATRMHVWTHLKPSAEGRTGLGLYPDGMVEHDDMVGGLLKRLDELGIADDTIIVYGTDNGAEEVTWPDGGTTPFRGEKGTTWEGGFRVPMLVRWPGVIKRGTIINEVFSQEDWLPTLLAAAASRTSSRS